MKLHIWTDEVSYLAVCHADSVADAREMLAVEVGGQDGSCPERAKAWKDISENNSAPYNGRVAAFCLSDSAEVREQLAYSEKVCAERDASRARITELEAALEAKHQQYTDAVIQLTEARKDGERLSYAEEHRLDMRHRSMFEPGKEHWEIVTAHTHPMHWKFFKGKTLREAIDAARGTR